jgi:hypothetical protein
MTGVKRVERAGTALPRGDQPMAPEIPPDRPPPLRDLALAGTVDSDRWIFTDNAYNPPPKNWREPLRQSYQARHQSQVQVPAGAANEAPPYVQRLRRRIIELGGVALDRAGALDHAMPLAYLSHWRSRYDADKRQAIADWVATGRYAGVFASDIPGAWYGGMHEAGRAHATLLLRPGALFAPCKGVHAQMLDIYDAWRREAGAAAASTALDPLTALRDADGTALAQKVVDWDKGHRDVEADLGPGFGNSGVVTDGRFYRDLGLAGYLGVLLHEFIIINPEAIAQIRFPLVQEGEPEGTAHPARPFTEWRRVLQDHDDLRRSLGRKPVRITPGTGWSYRFSDQTVRYPAHQLLDGSRRWVLTTIQRIANATRISSA